MKATFFFITMFYCFFASAQKTDTSIVVGNKVIFLDEVVVGRKLDVPAFVQYVKSDTSFYKAFKNLRFVNYSAINDIRMNKKDGTAKATYFSKSKQIYANRCRSLEQTEVASTGDFFNENNQYNYYTAEMYASLFFTKGTICNEENIIKPGDLDASGKKGMDKHRAQLKVLFFNPGRKIKGIPFISNKTGILDDDMAQHYDFSIEREQFKGTWCYVFKQKVKPDSKSYVVVDEMTTWFDDATMEIRARNYSLSYSATVYDFEVRMEVEITKVGKLLVPNLIRYYGSWKALFKDRERGVFTATLNDFKE